MTTHFLRTTALLNAVDLATRAPSPDHRRTWRWRVTDTGLHLHAGTNLIGAGAALHYALVSLTAQGWPPVVQRFPDPAAPGHVATIETGTRHEPTTAAVVLASAAITRLTRAGGADGPVREVSPDLLSALVLAAAAYGVAADVLTGPERTAEILLALSIPEADRPTARLATGEAVAAVLLAAESNGVRAGLLEAAGRAVWRGPQVLLRIRSPAAARSWATRAIGAGPETPDRLTEARRSG